MDTTTIPEHLTSAPDSGDPEREDLLQTLAQQRFFLTVTVRGLSDEQARQRTTVSRLHLAGLLRHVALTEAQWADFCVRGGAVFDDQPWAQPGGLDDIDPEAERPDFAAGEETLESLLTDYAQVAARTEEVVRSLPGLDVTHRLPVTPWWPAGGEWSARRALLHVIAETAQHCGHADIVRESLDGQQTMG